MSVSALFGYPGEVGVSRAVAEFHARRPILLQTGAKTLLVLPVEGLDRKRLADFVSLCAPAVPRLVISAPRALALGLDAKGPMALTFKGVPDADVIMMLAADADAGLPSDAAPAGPFAEAALALAKLSKGLPSVLVAPASEGAISDPFFVRVEAEAVARFHDDAIRSLTLSSRARVPLKSGRRAEFVVFRDLLGETSVAIIVGKPDVTRPVLVRLHSACLTGDVFGSRRCDCGDQLDLALAHLEDVGAGVVLYLPQEGRGLGLANKMRTYQMQDDGLDTVDANTTLGFDDDERHYGIAARMLEMLHCNRVVLLTNNPAKLDGLVKAGIEITGRLPVEAPINADNLRYLSAKAERAGHRLHHLGAAVLEDAERAAAPLAP